MPDTNGDEAASVGDYQRGIAVMERLWGADKTEQLRALWRGAHPDVERYITSFALGEVWARPGLDRKIKSLCTITALAALGRTRALELNLRIARNNGASRQEITEALLQIAPYAGFPAAWEALVILDQVFEAKKGQDYEVRGARTSRSKH